MTSEYCADNVLVQLSSQQVFAEPSCSTSSLSNSGRAQTSVSVAVELGRRLLLAARAGQTATVLELMAKGAPFTTDWLGTSPLHLAAANNHVETCAVLLRAGVSRDARTKVERTPLHMAAHAGNVAVITLLINHGASIDCRDMLQMTPLHWAAARGHVDAARALLRAGAARALRCKFRKTPRDLAARHRHHDLVALLDAADTADEDIEKPAEEEECPGEFAILHKISSPETPKNTETKRARKEKAIEMEIKPEPGSEEKTPAPGREERDSSSAAQLLRRHGITLLPADPGGTLLAALRTGRTVVLSDAGKLMLKESTSPAAPAPVPAAAPAPAAPPPARAARSPRSPRTPARPLKLMAVNNKLITNDRTPKYQQVKLVQLDGKLSAAKLVSGNKPVKIVLNKEHFHKIVAAKPAVTTANLSKVTIKTETEDKDTDTKEQGAASACADCANCAALRAELRAARAHVLALQAQLRALAD